MPTVSLTKNLYRTKDLGDNDRVGTNLMHDDAAYNRPTQTGYIEFDPELHGSRVRLSRDALVTWAEYTGIPVDFWKSLGVESEDDRHISFNWPKNGWKKVRDVTLRVDAQTAKDKVVRRFRWIRPPSASLKPLWPEPEEDTYEEIWLTEGESDCAVLRYLGLTAFTYGAATYVPGLIELRQLERLGTRRCILVYDADLPGRNASRKVEEALAGAGIETVNLDLNACLREFDYAKDIRDLFNRVEGAEVVKRLNALLEKEGRQQEEELDYKVRLKDAKSPEWVWDGLVAQGGLTLLYGPAKAGKTTLVYQMIAQMRKGGELLTREIKKQKILYYSEMPQAFDYERVQQYLPGLEEEDPFFFVRFAQDDVFQGKTWPAVALLLQKDVVRYGIDYVILDTANEWLHFASDEMYSATAVTEKLRPLRRLSSETGCTVQINHHPPKSGGSPFGSIAFQAYVDCLLELSRDEDGSELSAIGRIRSDFEGVRFRLEGRQYSIIQVDDKEDVSPGEGKSTMRERVLQLVPVAPSHITTEDLIADPVLAQFSKKSLQNLIRELASQGLITRQGDKAPFPWSRGFQPVFEKVPGI